MADTPAETQKPPGEATNDGEVATLASTEADAVADTEASHLDDEPPATAEEVLEPQPTTKETETPGTDPEAGPEPKSDEAADTSAGDTEVPTNEAGALDEMAEAIAPSFGGAGSAAILLKNRFNILPSEPLPDLDSPSARAFAVEDRLHPRQQEFALICIPGMPVRSEEISQISGQEIPGNLYLVDYGPVVWPSTGLTCLALIFERPLGGSVADVLASELQEFEKLDLINLVITQCIQGLIQVGTKGFTHRAIRANNIYFADEDRQQVVLGEFVSAPPGFDQPVAYETIELAMASEAGRGSADHFADLYAFGAVLAELTQRQNPVRGMNRVQLIMNKVNEGSYQTLVGRTLVTATLYELLRGLLNDDPDLRWDFEQVELWLSGRRVPPTQSRPAQKAQRPIKFGGVEHFSPRTLAFMIAEKKDTALKLIKDGLVEQWANRGLDDKGLAAGLAAAMEIRSARANDKGADDLLISRVIALLDPHGPIRYRDLSFMPDSFGGLLAIELLRDGDMDLLAEVVMKDVPAIWYEADDEAGAAQYTKDSIFGRLKEHLHKAAPGFGIERCLYDTNLGIPCQSPLIANAFVTTIKRLLPSLDAAEKTADTSKSPIDRHIAAFLASRYDRNVENYLAEMADPDETVGLLAMLRLLSNMQGDLGPERLLGLTKWVGGLMRPAINTFRSRATRRQIDSEVPKIIKQGSLPELLNLLDNPQVKNQDAADYAAAVFAFRKAEDEINDVENKMGPNSELAERSSKQAAAMAAILIMIFIISVLWIAG